MDNNQVEKMVTVPAVIFIPENAVELTIEAKVYEDGEIQTRRICLGMGDVRDVIQEAETCYFPDDVQFVLDREAE